MKNTNNIPTSVRFHLDRLANARAERSLFFSTYGFARGKAELDALDRRDYEAGADAAPYYSSGHVTGYARRESIAFLRKVRAQVPAANWAACLTYRAESA